MCRDNMHSADASAKGCMCAPLQLLYACQLQARKEAAPAAADAHAHAGARSLARCCCASRGKRRLAHPGHDLAVQTGRATRRRLGDLVLQPVDAVCAALVAVGLQRQDNARATKRAVLAQRCGARIWRKRVRPHNAACVALGAAGEIIPHR